MTAKISTDVVIIALICYSPLLWGTFYSYKNHCYIIIIHILHENYVIHHLLKVFDVTSNETLSELKFGYLDPQ